MSDLATLTQNPLKTLFASDGVATCMSVRVLRDHSVGRIAATAGFDALYVDLEHSVLSLESAAVLCHSAREAGVVPLVRVPSLDAAQIGRVLDGGAMGLILPHIASADQARTAVAAALYPPRGTRSVGSGQPLLHYRSFPTREACASLNQSVFIAIMVESAAGMAQVDAIAAVDGVDMLFVGTGDLSAEMGWQTGDDDAVCEAFAHVVAAATRHTKLVGAGGIVSRPELLQRLLCMGVRFISAGTDLSFLQAGAMQQIGVIRSAEQGLA